MPNPAIPIDPGMAHHFTLEAWDATDDGGKLALGDYLAERLQAHGRRVDEPLTLAAFGPPGAERSVLLWRDPATMMTFALVPGGTFRPGYDAAAIERVGALRRATGTEHDEETEERYGPLATYMAVPFGSPTPCDLRLGPVVAVPPAFWAVEPVRPLVPGLQAALAFADEVWKVRSRPSQGFPFLGDALMLDGDQVERVATHYGWSMPTSAEFEWALRGGSGTLFYWGNDLPAFALGRTTLTPEAYQASFNATLSADFALDRPEPSWPFRNQFGLKAMLPLQTWCAPAVDADVVIQRGGAAYCYPWQGCGEWELLLSAIEVRDSVDDAVLRPIIRLEIG